MRVPSGYLKRVFAGAVFGIYMAHLLFFLNPQIRVSPLRLTATAVIYALITGAIFGTALWLVHCVRWRGGHSEERAFGFVPIAAFLSACIYWGHVLLLRVYLPREAVRNLSKATVIVAGAALLLFLLWIAGRTIPRRFSRRIFATGAVIVVLSSLSLHVRRERYRPAERITATVAREARAPRQVVFVVVPNLSFDWIVQLGAEGVLPYLSSAREESFFSRIEPFPTTSANALWASLATGKLPHAHGVTGRFSYRTALNRGGERFLLVPYWVGFKAWGLLPPVKRISAELPAGDALPMWEIFNRSGYGAVVESWPFLKHRSNDPSGTLTVVSLPLVLDRAGGNVLPPQTTARGEAIRRAAENIDRALTRIAEQMSEQAVLVVASPCGPAPPRLPGTAGELIANWFRQEEPGSADGFLLVSSKETSSRANSAPAAVVDVVPTILFAAGLPVARDMDGRAVAEAFSERFVQENPIALIASYESR